MTPKAQPTKEIDKLDFLKIFLNCPSKDTITRVKRQHTEWGIFADIPNKVLRSRI